MQKLMMAVLVAAHAANVLAMPTRTEIAKAQPLVTELMADDVAALKAKSKKAEEVGDTSVKYAQEASTEAAKLLLLKSAVAYYVRGEQYDKAADAVNVLRTEIADMPPAVIEEIIRKNTMRVTAKKAPRLFAQYQTARVQVAAVKEAVATQAALAKKPKDAALTRKLAEAQALAGDWKSALATFAQTGGEVGATAKAEYEGRNLSDAADFWWAYESYLGADDADAFKSHAAEIYKKCLADGSIEGLKKNIVEKRLKQVEVVANPVKQDGTGAKKIGLQDKRVVLHLPNASDIVLIRCPAGRFTMGYDLKPTSFVRHEVSITRPFWMSEAQITVGQYCALMGSFEERFKPRSGVNPPDGLRKLEKIMGGDETIVAGTLTDESDRFCEMATQAFKSRIPSGYVVRLPTDAEREYGLSCGGKTKDRVYKELAEGKKNVKDLELVCGNEVEFAKQCMVRTGVTFHEADKSTLYAMPPRWKVKQFPPNDWGFFDMAGQNWERMFDRFPPMPNGNYSWDRSIAYANSQYTKLVDKNEPDPLMYYVGPNASPLVVMRQAWHAKLAGEPGVRSWHEVFRIVIGPDLVSEWKVKHGKK